MAHHHPRSERALVAHLRIFLRIDDQDQVQQRPVFAPDEFDVGRSDIKSLFNHVDMHISEHHVRMRCIVFDEDDSAVPPMVYLQVLSANGVLRCGDSSHEKRCLTRSDGAQLLNTGDSFKITTSVTVQYISDRLFSVPGVVQHRSTLCCKNDTYDLTQQTIGSGAYAKVVVARHRTTGMQLACKILPLRRPDHPVDTGWLELIDRELEILRRIDHPNVTAVRKALWTMDNLYIVQDLATGGDLMSYQQQNGVLGESEVLSMTFQLVQAVHHLHDLGVVHRDIKPENILLTSWRRGARIMLADFGQARFLQTELNSAGEELDVCRMNSIAGTPGWQAPELRRSTLTELNYGKAVDMWSIGSIVFVALIGRRPDDWLEAPEATSADTTIRQEHFDTCFCCLPEHISTKAAQFMQNCLRIDEQQRMTAEQAVEHAWFTCELYKDELRAQYRRAIRLWTPRLQNETLVEDCNVQESCPTDLGAESTSASLLSATSAEAEHYNDLGPSVHDFVPPRSTQLSEPRIGRG